MEPLADRLALHTWTLEPLPLPDMLRVAREAGYNAVELRWDEFERERRQGRTDDETIATLRESGLEVAVLGIQNGLLYAEGDDQERLYESLARSAAHAVALGCEVLGTSSGQNMPRKEMKEVVSSLKRAGDVVEKYGLRLALEANSRHPVLNNPRLALQVVKEADHPACGILLDAYHMECGGYGGRGFDFVPGELIWAFQYSDAPLPAQRSTARKPLDRLPPGDGIVRWREMYDLLCEKGYRGHLAYEAPNPAQWSRDPAEVAREGFRIIDLVGNGTA